MGETTTGTRADRTEHVRDRIEDYLSGRLESGPQVEFEAHLLTCDSCFTAYLLSTLDDL